ncbi:MAG: hypothetical protein HY869_12785 [Chloroflexi bacterium]|nr:hypothetical protein [Chloroflexota bacterium]
MSHRQARQDRKENRFKTLGALRTLGGSTMSHCQARQEREEDSLKSLALFAPLAVEKCLTAKRAKAAKKTDKKTLAVQ